MENPHAAIGILVLGLAWGVVKASRIAVAIWFGLCYPNAGRRIVRAYEDRPVKCLLIGAVDVLLSLLIGLALLQTKALAFVGLLMLFALCAAIILAYGPAYYLLGRRFVVGDNARARVLTLFWGGVISEGVYCAPIIGQLLSIGTMLRGLGAIVLALVAARGTKDAAEEE